MCCSRWWNLAADAGGHRHQHLGVKKENLSQRPADSLQAGWEWQLRLSLWGEEYGCGWCTEAWGGGRWDREHTTAPCGLQLMTSEGPAVSPMQGRGWRSPAGGGGTGFPCREAHRKWDPPTTNDRLKSQPDTHGEGVWWLCSADMLYVRPAFHLKG